MFAKIIASFRYFLKRYFGKDFRVTEFFVALGIGFGAGMKFAMILGLPAERAQWIGYFGVLLAGFSYCRNPKNREWKDHPKDHPIQSAPRPARASRGTSKKTATAKEPEQAETPEGTPDA